MSLKLYSEVYLNRNLPSTNRDHECTNGTRLVGRDSFLPVGQLTTVPQEVPATNAKRLELQSAAQVLIGVRIDLFDALNHGIDLFGAGLQLIAFDLLIGEGLFDQLLDHILAHLEEYLALFFRIVCLSLDLLGVWFEGLIELGQQNDIVVDHRHNAMDDFGPGPPGPNGKGHERCANPRQPKDKRPENRPVWMNSHNFHIQGACDLPLQGRVNFLKASQLISTL